MSSGELLKTITVALAQANPEALKLPKSGKGRQNLGEFYREYSKLSTHTLDISESTLKSQLTALIRSNVELVEIIGASNIDTYISAAVTEFRSNIFRYVSANSSKFKYSGSDEVSTTFKGDNYQQIRNLLNAGFGTTNAYNIKIFLDKVLKSTGNQIDISSVELGKKFGLDVGHYHSNIISAYGAVIFNAVRRGKTLDLTSDAVVKEIDSLYSKLNDPSIASALMERLGIDDRELFNACVNATVGFTKSIVNNKLSVILKTEPKLDSTVIKKIASQVLDKTFPEFSVTNQQKGASLEKAISNHLSKATSGYFLKLMNEIAIGKHMDLLGQRGSKSALELVEGHLINILTNKQVKNTKTNTSITTKKNVSFNIPGSVPTPKGNRNTIKKVAVPKLPKLRSPKGTFTSIVSLEILIRAALPPVLLKNMERPNLRNQTSRFRNSVELNSLVRQRDGTLTAFLSYMKYPYATFEKGGKQGRKGYHPTRLIDQSVREIASKLVTERLRVVVT